MAKWKSEPPESEQSSVPGWTREAGTRLAQVIEALGGATRSGELIAVKPEQLARWRDGKARPPLFGVAQLAKAAGKSLDWVVFGEDSALPEPEASAPTLDPHLYGVISGEVARVFKEVGLAASAHTVGEEAAKIAAEILGSGVAGDEALPAVRVLVAQLRRRLFAELAAPETRKRQG